ncbi:MAG TPA: sensor histidine kinase [Ktedonobacterales bacterium]|nr:sensor histidine kinase [Ktedonobacterales bacterium]
MSSKPAATSAFRIAMAERLLFGAGYTTLVLGYLLGILLAKHLTLLTFLAFTCVQLLYVAGLVMLTRSAPATRHFVLPLYALAFTLLSMASGILSGTGIYWDWLLYLITVAIYFQLLPFRIALVSSLLLYGVMVLNLAFLDHWYLSLDLFSNGVSILAAFGFVVGFSLALALLQEQKERAELLLQEVERSRQQLEEAHTQLRLYAGQVEELAVARERTRVAREIHDTLGHYLSILNVQLETISRLVERDPSRLAEEIAEARHVAAQSMQEVRTAVAALRPAGMATLSLSQALDQLGDEFKRAAQDTALTLDLEAELPPLAPDVQVALYRAAQEALTNVRKHAHASNVLVRLRYEEGWLELLVLDNGSGAATAQAAVLRGSQQKAGGFGLIGLEERMKLLGGQVIHGPASPDGYGYRVTVRVQPAAQGTPTPASLEVTQGARE